MPYSLIINTAQAVIIGVTLLPTLLVVKVLLGIIAGGIAAILAVFVHAVTDDAEHDHVVQGIRAHPGYW